LPDIVHFCRSFHRITLKLERLMDDDDFPCKPGPDGELPILVAGGGISGLYCAYRLAQRGHRVVVLERSRDCWGGRIETAQMDGFVAEYGPMRFELDLQPHFARLLGELGIRTEPFTGPVAEVAEYPKYDLTPAEQGLTSLQLLRRGLLLIMGRTLAPGDPAGDSPEHQDWIDSLDDAAYDRIRMCTEMGGEPLWKTGFWNALSANGVLSHQALMKVRDTGTFYHMIPENLNAVEWTIWWLRGLKTKGRVMQKLEGGSEILTTRILERLRAFGDRVVLLDGWRVKEFRTEPGQANVVRVTVQREDGGTDYALAAHLVLALPRWPLKQLADWLPADIRPLLDAVVGFPMTKVFFVTDKPWWDYDQKPQTRASRMPTREVHYFRRPRDDDRDGHGMVLIYTDRPATEYWNVYVDDREGHDRAEIDGNPELKAQFARWLAREAKGAIDHLRETLDRIPPELRADLGDALRVLLPNLPLSANVIDRFAEMTEDAVAQEIADTVITWGIRDWSLPPYGAANHSWKPGYKSWEVMAALKQFRLDAGCPEIVHVCGEAYSDYSGFIEGALRSAEAALATIPDPKPAATLVAA
jgi:hypothetical protein